MYTCASCGVWVFMYVYVYIYIFKTICIFMYVCIYYICRYLHIHTYIYTCILLYAGNAYIHREAPIVTCAVVVVVEWLIGLVLLDYLFIFKKNRYWANRLTCYNSLAS